MTRYWLWWFLLTFPVGFLIPETIALVRNRTQDTLSGAIWNLEKLKVGQGPWGWTAAHFLFTGAFFLTAVWLTGHFGWGLWK